MPAENFERHAENALMRWKNFKAHKPIVLRGARQVGKTTLVRRFSRNFKHYIELNMERSTDRKWSDTSDSATELMESLSLQLEIPKEEWSDTLLFIDEIQEVPKMMEFLRFFYEDIPELYVVAAGSLLEYSFDNVQTIPVGRIQYMYLFPLNFDEYLGTHSKDLLQKALRQLPPDDSVHEPLLQAFHEYAIIGGMPEIVSNYLETRDVTTLLPVYSSIWDTYKDDVPKYTTNPTDKKVVEYIIHSAAQLIDQRIKFQNFGNSNYKSREVGEAFRALDDAKVIQLVYPCTETEPPTLDNLKKSPRMQFLDTGLLNYDLKIQANLLLLEDLSDAYRGAIIPHLFTQELISTQEISYKKPNFWVRDKNQSQAEVDLLITVGNYLIPIEVKSGATGKLRSLHQFVDRCDHSYAIRVYGGKFRIEKSKTPAGKVYTLMNLPYYLGTRVREYAEYFVENY